ncbi:hypothetical protein [Occultella gossypii]|uniref:DUF624 domain-containing protein n=1 Tax=Occultella gossypii TaxID=2800820 RepID=A0ABS7SBU3_9MICO|nr:hypothetical protein [Occultella gossypii]MBZ2197737.1 hypothetical protein [Occultella gossypii]
MDLNRFLRVPAALIAANWAGLLGVVSVVGVIPAFAGNARVMADLDEHADVSGRVVFAQIRRTTRRDLPVSLAWWAYVLLGAATAWLMVTAFEGGTRVFFVGVLVPVYWIVGALIGAYIRAAGTLGLGASRAAVTAEAGRLVFTAPVRTLMTVPVVLAMTPVWALPPITIACGLSLPAWALSKIWGPTTTAAQRRAETDTNPDTWNLTPA